MKLSAGISFVCMYSTVKVFAYTYSRAQQVYISIQYSTVCSQRISFIIRRIIQRLLYSIMIILFRSNLMSINSLIIAIAFLLVFIKVSSSASVEAVVIVYCFTDLQAIGPLQSCITNLKVDCQSIILSAKNKSENTSKAGAESLVN